VWGEEGEGGYGDEEGELMGQKKEQDERGDGEGEMMSRGRGRG
jgi:hypothetical protein